MKKPTRLQLELFAVPRLPITLPPSQRSEALALLQSLLMEALLKTNATSEIEEHEVLDDDKDHA
jgi:hypothetical protein